MGKTLSLLWLDLGVLTSPLGFLGCLKNRLLFSLNITIPCLLQKVLLLYIFRKHQFFSFWSYLIERILLIKKASLFKITKTFINNLKTQISINPSLTQQMGAARRSRDCKGRIGFVNSEFLGLIQIQYGRRPKESKIT